MTKPIPEYVSDCCELFQAFIKMGHFQWLPHYDDKSDMVFFAWHMVFERKNDVVMTRIIEYCPFCGTPIKKGESDD